MDIREIAKRAKVSTATVSRTINRVPTVDPALAKRVLKVVEDMGYYPNSQARALVSGKSRIFGLIVSEITNPFFPEIVQTFETRAVEQRSPKIPILSDLRESGSIEQDADLVMFIYRDDYYNKDSEKQGIADVHIAKHRNGPTGQISLLFNQRTTKFLDLEVYRD